MILNIGPALIIRYGIKKKRFEKRSSAVICAVVIGFIVFTSVYFLMGYASGTAEGLYGFINYFILRPKKEENE